MTRLDVSPAHLAAVKKILKKYAPEFEVRAFGSRVRLSARKNSDFDIALITKSPLALGRLAEMREAFSESDLPFIVDIADFSAVSENFRRIILAESIVIQKPSVRRK